MSQKRDAKTEVELEIQGPEGAIAVRGQLGNIHEDPQKIHQLLDLLGLPKGTEVRITTKVGSVIVR